VVFVHREEYFHHGEDKDQYEGQAEVIIAKQRNGPVGTIELRWEKEYTRFQNLAPERLQEFDDYSREVVHADDF
jgi:replicative DNA helicase